MKIPFTAPSLGEFETMPADSKAALLRRYAESKAARGLLLTVKTILFAAIFIGVGGFMAADFMGAFRTVMKLGCVGLSFLLVVSSVVYYRKASENVLRKMIRDAEKEDGSPTKP